MSHSEFERDDWINCCSGSIHNCGNFKSYGYNCFGLDANGYNQPCGVIVQKKLDQLIKAQKIGTCKCPTDEDYQPCTCGIFTIDMGSYGNSKQVYLSNFTERIRTNASHSQHLQSIYALEHGTEIEYQVPDKY